MDFKVKICRNGNVLEHTIHYVNSVEHLKECVMDTYGKDAVILEMERVPHITKLTLDDFAPMGIQEFYEKVAKKYGYNTSHEDIMYDCRHIEIAENIQDKFYEYYREQCGNGNDVDVQITMLLAMSGPKVKSDLADNEVEFDDEFVTFGGIK